MSQGETHNHSGRKHRTFLALDSEGQAKDAYTLSVARPRVILACDHPDVAVRMIGALNPKRYRVEHIFDLSEALLRANFVLAHALVIHPESFSSPVLDEAKQSCGRLTPLVVSADPAQQAYAESLGARFVSDPFDVPTFKRAVYRAVSKTQERRQQVPMDPPTGVRRVARVLLLHRSRNEGNVMVAVLKNQLSTSVDLVTNARDALELISPRLDCMVTPPSAIVATAEGAQLARRLAQLGVPLVPLEGLDRVDPSDAAQLAWDVAPRVRRSLAARARMREAG